MDLLEKTKRDQSKRMVNLKKGMVKVRENTELVEAHAEYVDKAFGVINSANCQRRHRGNCVTTSASVGEMRSRTFKSWKNTSVWEMHTYMPIFTERRSVSCERNGAGLPRMQMEIFILKQRIVIMGHPLIYLEVTLRDAMTHALSLAWLVMFVTNMLMTMYSLRMASMVNWRVKSLPPTAQRRRTRLCSKIRSISHVNWWYGCWHQCNWFMVGSSINITVAVSVMDGTMRVILVELYNQGIVYVFTGHQSTRRSR